MIVFVTLVFTTTTYRNNNNNNNKSPYYSNVGYEIGIPLLLSTMEKTVTSKNITASRISTHSSNSNSANTNTSTAYYYILPSGGIQIKKPIPTFQTTSRDLLGAIDLCIRHTKERNQNRNHQANQQVRSRCSIVHITTQGIFLDQETSGSLNLNNLDDHPTKKTKKLKWMTTDDNDDDDHRISYITTFLQS